MRAGYHPAHKAAEKKDARKNSLKEAGFYHTGSWRRLRVLALQRDHYLCQNCLRQKRVTIATEVHHIKPIADFPELALTLDNLESLCWDCHEQTKPRGTPLEIPGVKIIRITGSSGDD